MHNLFKELNQTIAGDIHHDTFTRRAYSVDASIYEIEPIGIVIPRDTADIVTAIKAAVRYGIPIIARGAATGITGGCIGKGLILDTSVYLNKILEINYEQEYAICQPGVVQDQLNQELSAKGYRLGPDTSTGDRATLGGMLANNSAGSRSLRFGKMVDCILSVEIILASGELVEFQPVSEAEWEQKRSLQNSEGHIYREIYRIKNQYREEIESKFPKIPRHVSGYNLDELIKPGPLNLAKLITGSEGTLGVITKLKVQIAKKPVSPVLCLVHLDNMLEGMKHIPKMLKHNPLALELIDDKIIEMGRASPSMRGKLEWLHGKPHAIFVAEFDGGQALAKAEAFKADLMQNRIGYAFPIVTDNATIKNVWGIRKAGLGLLLSRRTYSRAIAFIEDLSVAPEHLYSFMGRLIDYLNKADKQAGIYGHIGSGCMHIRPYIDLRQPGDLALMKQIMLDVTDLVIEEGGTLSGEHGDGLIRTWLNQKLFGETLYQAFCELKEAFDPKNLMNPGKIVFGPPPEENLRLNPETRIVKIPTFLDFSREGGFELSADLCNGNAQCRKKEGTMCPSFQASGEEYTTTRARAQALRAVINSRLPLASLTSKDMHDILDLCIECKGCKAECPSQVDMAKMKAEFLYQYQEKHGYSLRGRFLGNIASFNKIASPLAEAFNKLGNGIVAKILLGWLGIAPERSLPPLAKQTFSQWLLKNSHAAMGEEVVLFNDTFSEFNYPNIGISAYKVLCAMGYKVIVPPWNCCGRPLISKGLLKQAQIKAKKLISSLYPFAERGLPIIGLEPSCILTVKDDLRDLVDDHKITSLMNACITFDEFIANHLQKGLQPPSFKLENRSVLLHGHCHQKALVGTKPTLSVLKAIPGFEVREIASGCCGMAGSFGYEKEHYDFSMKIGELRLFPAIRASLKDALIVADGFSCRSQIEHGTKRQAKHLAEVLADNLDLI